MLAISASSGVLPVSVPVGVTVGVDSMNKGSPRSCSLIPEIIEKDNLSLPGVSPESNTDKSTLSYLCVVAIDWKERSCV